MTLNPDDIEVTFTFTRQSWHGNRFLDYLGVNVKVLVRYEKRNLHVRNKLLREWLALCDLEKEQETLDTLDILARAEFIRRYPNG